MQYTKPWLSIDEQIDKLKERGVLIDDRAAAARLLRTIGYYRLTGYLYPFRVSGRSVGDDDRSFMHITNSYREGTRIEQAGRLADFDRSLRVLVLEGVERIEIALRTQIGHCIGRRGAFAHHEPSHFIPAFTEPRTDLDGQSQLATWHQRIDHRRDSSDEAFVVHFREKYDDRMPIWALTEILELGHLSRLYGGLQNDIATEIAIEFGVPTKRLMQSWIATINYVRNIAAHHARLYNRKLVIAPRRPKMGQIVLLDHLRDESVPKDFGTYNALAIMACLLRAIESDGDWATRLAAHLRSFPAAGSLDIGSLGIAPGWLQEPLWTASRGGSVTSWGARFGTIGRSPCDESVPGRELLPTT